MTVESECIAQIVKRFGEAFSRIEQAVAQLDEEQVWLHPSPSSNSAGIILQHLTGNLAQWILSGVGGAEDHRNRPLEFMDARHPSKEEIMNRFRILGRDVAATVSAVPPQSLLERRQIQGMEVTVLAALIAAVTHCEFHEGQLLFISKLLLNERYQPLWGPPKK